MAGSYSPRKVIEDLHKELENFASGPLKQSVREALEDAWKEQKELHQQALQEQSAHHKCALLELASHHEQALKEQIAHHARVLTEHASPHEILQTVKEHHEQGAAELREIRSKLHECHISLHRQATHSMEMNLPIVSPHFSQIVKRATDTVKEPLSPMKFPERLKLGRKSFKKPADHQAACKAVVPGVGATAQVGSVADSVVSSPAASSPNMSSLPLQQLTGTGETFKLSPRLSPRSDTIESPRTAADSLDERPLLEAVNDTGQVSNVTGRWQLLSLSSWQQLMNFVRTPRFDQLVGCMLVLNAAFLGLETEYAAVFPNRPSPIFVTISEPLFCFLFATEWILRICCYGRYYFWHPIMANRLWHWFDTLIVSTQLVEQLLLVIAARADAQKLGIMRKVLRILRICRVVRLVRSFRAFDELRAIVHSVITLTRCLGWSFVLLFMLVFIVSVIFMQVKLGLELTDCSEEMNYWFPTLSRTLFTVFECLIGGVSWDHVVEPMAADMSPALAVLFCAYLAGCLLVTMDLVAGVIRDKAMQAVREDKDHTLADRVRQLFGTNRKHADSDDVIITFEDFEDKLGSQALIDYFQQVDVDIAEANSLFRLIDTGNTGSISTKEFVDGALRLRGPAKEIDLSLLIRDVDHLHEKMDHSMRRMEQFIGKATRKSESNLSL